MAVTLLKFYSTSALFPAAEVETLVGDPSNARAKLGWVPQISVEELCQEMLEADLETARKHSLLRDHGHSVSVSRE